MGRLVSLLGLISCAGTALAPALCVAGLLSHRCETTHPSPCDHESDCTVDPCKAVYVRPDLLDTINLAPQSHLVEVALDLSSSLLFSVSPVRYDSPPHGGAGLDALGTVVLLI